MPSHLLLLVVLMSAIPPVLATDELPEFTSQRAEHWLNSPPLQRAGLKGKVVLLDIWTFDCWNCYRSFPWLNDLEKRLHGQDFVVIGIHSPEFNHEKDPQKVAAKISAFGLQHPVMLDNDFRYWRALSNKYWPSYYLVDKKGRIRHRHIGETHKGDSRATLIEHQIKALLTE